jgi:DnaJ-class molecular chaperone
MNTLQTNYDLLEITATSSIEEIKKSYRRLCLKHHPDKTNNQDSGHFLRIKKAYEEVVKAKETNINLFIMFFYFIHTFGKDHNVTINLKIKIEDIYNNAIKKISFKRVGQDLEKTSIFFYLELCGWKEQYVIEGHGDYNIVTKRFGDLVINLEMSNENYSHLQINKIINLYDVYTEVEINLYEYYYGVKKTITYFNNEQIELDFLPHIDGDTQLVDGKGLTNDDDERAHLYIFYKVNLQLCDITDINESIIKNIFNR